MGFNSGFKGLILGLQTPILLEQGAELGPGLVRRNFRKNKSLYPIWDQKAIPPTYRS